HVALGDRTHIDQDLTDFVAALQLQFQRAIDILLLNLAAVEEDFAQALEARTDPLHSGFGLGNRGHYCSSTCTLPVSASLRAARISTCEGIPVISSHGS